MATPSNLKVLQFIYTVFNEKQLEIVEERSQWKSVWPIKSLRGLFSKKYDKTQILIQKAQKLSLKVTRSISLGKELTVEEKQQFKYLLRKLYWSMEVALKNKRAILPKETLIVKIAQSNLEQWEQLLVKFDQRFLLHYGTIHKVDLQLTLDSLPKLLEDAFLLKVISPKSFLQPVLAILRHQIAIRKLRLRSQVANVLLI